MAASSALRVAPELEAFLVKEALPGTGVAPDAFFAGMESLLRDLAPRNAALLAKRDEIQAKVDAWHRAHPAKPIDAAAYEDFLRGIGYLLDPPGEVQVSTANVDPEIATIAGPRDR